MYAIRELISFMYFLLDCYFMFGKFDKMAICKCLVRKTIPTYTVFLPMVSLYLVL